MNNILKKIFSCACIALLAGSVSSPAYCGKVDGKISEEKKPFKAEHLKKSNSSVKAKPLKIENSAVTEQKMYEKFFSEEIYNSAYGSDRHVFCAGMRTFKMNDLLDYIAKGFKKVIFESGSISVNSFTKILLNLGIDDEDCIWKKEIYPLTMGDTVVKDGFVLIVTHKSKGSQLVFYFKFGNNTTFRGLSKYSFIANARMYNRCLNLSLRLQPENPLNVEFRPVDWSEVTSAIVPSKAVNIWNESFSELYALRIVDVFGEKFSVAQKSFFACLNLEKVNFHGAVASVDKEAFKECYKLKELNFPYGLKFIGEFAFEKCCDLKKITIPLSTQIVYSSAFKDTSKDLKIIYGGKQYDVKGFRNALLASGGIMYD